MTDAVGKTNDPLVEYPGYLLRRASVAALNDLNGRLARYELRHAEFALLRLIRTNAGINQTEAGRALEIQRPNMATLVAKLERRGLVERKPIDRRSQALRLTPDGRALLRKASAAVDACERDLIEAVPAEIRPMVIPVLTALWQAAGAEDATEGTSRHLQKIQNF